MVDHEDRRDGSNYRIIFFRIFDIDRGKVRINGITGDIGKNTLIFKVANGFLIKKCLKSGREENVGQVISIFNSLNVLFDPVGTNGCCFQFVADGIAGFCGVVFNEGIKPFQQR